VVRRAHRRRSAAGYRYVGDLERNHLLPTAVGVAAPSALVPETMAEGDMRGASRCASSGTRRCATSTPRCARPTSGARASRRARSSRARASTAPTPTRSGLARRFDDPGFRAAFAGELAPLLRGDERVALPAVLGLRDPHGAWADLQRRLGAASSRSRRCRRRCPACALRGPARRAARGGGRLILGSEVIGADRDGGARRAVRATPPATTSRYHARWFVLATGGFASGGDRVGSDWVTRETALGLPLRGVPSRASRASSATTSPSSRWRASAWRSTARCAPRATENVLVAGAALPAPCRGARVGRGHRAGQRPPRGGGRPRAEGRDVEAAA
jgi:glycerol-3-phosphate dehydrogenase subunit B